MAENFPGPYQLDIHYTCSGRQHVAKYNCNTDGTPTAGDDLSTVYLVQRDAGLVSVVDALTAWVTLIKNQFHTSVTFDYAEFWSVAPLSSERTFIGSQTLGINGTSSTAVELAHQSTYTFRTVEGGILKIVMLEDSSTNQLRVPYASLGTNQKAIMDFVDSDDSWILARDTSYAIAKLNCTSGQNEAIFKSRYR